MTEKHAFELRLLIGVELAFGRELDERAHPFRERRWRDGRSRRGLASPPAREDERSAALARRARLGDYDDGEGTC